MTESAEPNLDEAIRALRHDVLSAGPVVDWDDVRARVKRLIREREPDQAQRAALVETYYRAADAVERRLRGDPEGLDRLGYQRAADTLTFHFAEMRAMGDRLTPGMATAILSRERRAGRMRMDRYLTRLVTWLLEEFGDDTDGSPPGVREVPAAFILPAAVSRPPAIRPARPGW